MSNKKLGIEENLQNLEQILSRISNEDTPLEEAIDLYAKASKIIVTCNNQLEKARIKIKEIDTTLETVGKEDEF